MKRHSFPEKITARDGGVAIENFSEANRDELWEMIQSDREIRERHGLWPDIRSFVDLVSYVRSCEIQGSDAGEIGYLVRDFEGHAVGTLHVFAKDWAGPAVEFGYWLHHRCTGRGLATKALSLIEEVPLSLGFSRLQITCREWNAKSWAVAERAGYSFVKRYHKDRDCVGCDECMRLY